MPPYRTRDNLLGGRQTRKLQGAHMDKLEEQMAHLIRTVDDLSDVVARQETEIATLTRRVHMLMQREGEREAAGSDGVVIGNERPPHY
jgi:SlyX protein